MSVIKRTIYLLLICFFIFQFFGCSLPDINQGISEENDRFDPDRKIELGFANTDSTIWTGLRLEKASLKENETLVAKFYYGTLLSDFDFLVLYRKGNTMPDEIKTTIVLKRSECIFESPSEEGDSTIKVSYQEVSKDLKKTITDFNKDHYPHISVSEDLLYEEIILTPDLFSGEIGCLTFLLQTNASFSGIVDEEKTYGNGFNLYYEVTDEMIKLYDDVNEFNNVVFRVAKSSKNQ